MDQPKHLDGRGAPSSGGVAEIVARSAAGIGFEQEVRRFDQSGQTTSRVPGARDQSLLGHRRWSDQKLIEAVRDSTSWEEVAERLGLVRDHLTGLRVKGHAVRLGIDLSHLDDPTPIRPSLDNLAREPQLSSLRHAAPLIVASWFAVGGFPVSLPSEPQPYDLLVFTPEGIQRVQVKSSTSAISNGSWHVGIGRRPYSVEKNLGKVPYDPDDLVIFAVVEVDRGIYVIPIEAIAGLTSIYLSAYEEYLVGNVAGLFQPPELVETPR